MPTTADMAARVGPSLSSLDDGCLSLGLVGEWAAPSNGGVPDLSALMGSVASAQALWGGGLPDATYANAGTAFGSPDGPTRFGLPEEDDEEAGEMDGHLAAISGLLDDADSPEAKSESKMRHDAPEFVPMQQLHQPVPVPSPLPSPASSTPLSVDSPTLQSSWKGGAYRIDWKVPCSKLTSKDKIVVSPAFRVHPSTTFKLLLAPRSKPGPGEELGSPAFGSTRFGSLQLKCVEDRSTMPTSVMGFRLFVGEEYSVILHHNFKSCAVATDEHLWDLRAEVDGRSRMLTVGVEFLDM